MFTAAALLVYVLVITVLFMLRRALGMFWATSAFLAATLFYLARGFDPPLPGSIVRIFGGAVVVGVLLYVTSSEAGREAFFGPIRQVFVDPRRRNTLAALM